MAERRLRGALEEGLELGRDALREIRAHPLRSLLTLSGIVFGAASLVSMTSLADALRSMANDELSRMGLPRSAEYFDRRPDAAVQRAVDVRFHGLRRADLEALRDVPGVVSVHGTASGGQAVVATERDRRLVPLVGVDAGYISLQSWPIVAGRELADLDVANAARVAVLGSELVEPLFGQADPVGRTLTIDGTRFRIVGVAAPVEIDLIPADFSFLARRVYVPWTVLSRTRLGEGRVGSIVVTAASDAELGTVFEDARATLVRRHQVEDFREQNHAAGVAADLAMADSILGGWNLVLFVIAGVTLFVGGIGLFSVLLISVRERVREIGIRKALGADDGAILRLFLAESLTLAALGAALGVGGGVGLIVVTETIARSFGRAFVIPLHGPGTALAVGFALIVGLGFGWYPARRAARLDPVEAITEV